MQRLSSTARVYCHTHNCIISYKSLIIYNTMHMLYNNYNDGKIIWCCYLYLLQLVFIKGSYRKDVFIVSKIDKQLEKLEIKLPISAATIANYLPFVKVNNMIYISGQLPIDIDGDSKVKYIGKVGTDVTVDDALAAAKLCGINLLAQLKIACEGNLDLVIRCVQLSGFVNANGDFSEHPKIINGCSDLMMDVFGEKGKHSRIAVGSSSLPLNASVEIGGIFETI